MPQSASRRMFLQQAVLSTGLAGAGFGAGSLFSSSPTCADDARPRLPVAGVTTVYQKNSHADVIFGKILEGYTQQGGPGPDLQLVSMYVEQVGKSDKSRRLAEKHGVYLADTIEQAITVGGKSVAVAGVLSVGEHGNYPYTKETRQHQYPRRRFFDAIAAAFEKYGKVVPVFNDKHLSYAWRDAKHIVETARRMKMPLMAGSSIPVAWRHPALVLEPDCEIEEAIGIGYGGAESYGFHMLEGLQCMVERRKGGETGVAHVQALTGDAIWQAEKQGRWSRELLQHALKVFSTAPDAPKVKQGPLEKNLNSKTPFYLIEYRDGLRATGAMLNGVSHDFGFVARLKGKKQPVACRFAVEDKTPYGHFAWLVQAIEHMIRTGQPAYPVERTLLTTGVLDRAMHSLAEGNIRLTTPELDLQYKRGDWPFANTPLYEPPMKVRG